MRFEAFREEHLDDAAQLLAQRHRRDRETRPHLPEKYSENSIARQALEAEWKKENGTGIVAIKGEEVAGFLLGIPMVDTNRGRSVWIPYAGSAIAAGESAELYRHLYAHLAGQWVAKGYFQHFAQVPAGDAELVDAWFRLGFGHQQVYALLDLDEVPAEIRPIDDDLVIRRGTVEDREALRQAAEWNTLHQAQAPGWNPVLPEILEETRAGYAGIVDDREAKLWIAERQGELVGFHVYWPVSPEQEDMIAPEKCVDLVAASTRPDMRGTGIGQLLTGFCLQQVKAEGYRYCRTDWFMLNLLASRFWPQQGFQPVMYRLARRMDERIAWANGTHRG